MPGPGAGNRIVVNVGTEPRVWKPGECARVEGEGLDIGVLGQEQSVVG